MEYKITIPEPCDEEWAGMTPTEKGMFCANCKKEVLDFTHKSKHDLSKLLDAEKKICGRFRPEQLNIAFASARDNSMSRTGALFGLASLLSLTTPALGQDEGIPLSVPTERPMATDHRAILGKIAVNPAQESASETILIEGIVRDAEGPLPGANLVLKGTKIGTQTDFDGKYSIHIPHDRLEGSGELIVSYIGFETAFRTIDRKTRYLNIDMTESHEILGELVIVRKPNVFQRIGSLFKRQGGNSCE